VPETSDDLFRVLADPTRRRILDLLAERGPLTVGQLAGEFPGLVSSGISKHLMGLRAAGLVSATRRGREQLYRLEAEALSDGLAPWLARYEPYWSAALERLRGLAEGAEPAPRARRAGASRRPAPGSGMCAADDGDDEE
jgi:DNA-binding transcriptional ArsR family regulator